MRNSKASPFAIFALSTSIAIGSFCSSLSHADIMSVTRDDAKTEAANNGGSSNSPTGNSPTGGKVIWDYWYTVAVKSFPYEYYNEKVILRDEKIQFFNHVWRKEEGFINEEQLGAFSDANMDLTPLFFNYRSTYRTNEVKIDGNIHDGKNFVVKVKKGTESLPIVNRSISPKTFLSIFFPLWLGKQLQTAKEGSSQGFQTVLEDNIDNGFDSVSGRIRLEKPDAFATKTHTKKVAVDYKDDQRSYWWVDDKGAALKIEMPERETVVERVSQAKAESFLK